MKNKKSASALLALLIIAAVVVANVLLGAAGPYMDIDLSNRDLYSISESSVEFLSLLEDGVEIIVFSDEPDARIVKYVSKYCSFSDKLSWRQLSPVQHPELLSQYDTSADTLIVSCAAKGRYKCLEFSDIVEYDLMRYAYYGDYQETAFDAESELTNAVSYVTSEKSFVACFTQGHGEAEAAAVLREEMEKSRFEIMHCDLMREGAVPEGCDTVIINAPGADLALDEVQMLGRFMDNGGTVVLLISSDFTGDYSALAELSADAGIIIGEGVVKDPGSCYQNEYLIFPQIGTSDDITRYLGSDAKCLLYRARPLALFDEQTENLSVRELLSTSPKGVATDIFGAESGEGSILLAASAAWKDGGKLVVLPASLISETTIANYGNLSNSEIFINAIMAGLADEESHVIASVPLGNTLNAVTSGGIYSVSVVAVLPGLLLVLGALHCLRRRRG